MIRLAIDLTSRSRLPAVIQPKLEILSADSATAPLPRSGAADPTQSNTVAKSYYA